MTPERWLEVKKALADALERTPEERSAYLEQACAEPDMRREVESLILAQEQAQTSLMAEPAAQPKELAIGSRLGTYEILARIGAGGMGEVYRARDTRLERSVAIKILPNAFSADSDRLHRFEREARSVSALNHPNIVTIYELGQDGSTHYIAMELIEGKTLRELLAGGLLPIRKAIEIAAQVAEGLAKAHEAGIVAPGLKAREPDGLSRRIRQNPGFWAGEACVDQWRPVGCGHRVRVPDSTGHASRNGGIYVTGAGWAVINWISGQTSFRSAWCSTRW